MLSWSVPVVALALANASSPSVGATKKEVSGEGDSDSVSGSSSSDSSSGSAVPAAPATVALGGASPAPARQGEESADAGAAPGGSATDAPLAPAAGTASAAAVAVVAPVATMPVAETTVATDAAGACTALSSDTASSPAAAPHAFAGAPPPLAARVPGPPTQADETERRWRVLLRREAAFQRERAALTDAQSTHAATVRAFEVTQSRSELLRAECLRERDALRQQLQERADSTLRGPAGQVYVQVGELRESLRREAARRERLEAELQALRRKASW